MHAGHGALGFPTDSGRAVCASWSQVAAFSHSTSVGRRAPCARAKASASNQETWTTGPVAGRSGSSRPSRHSPARSAVQPLRAGDVVLLLPGPALVRPPLAPLVAAALDEGQVGGVGDRRAADQVAAHVGAVAGALVVVGEARAPARRSCTDRPGTSTSSRPVWDGGRRARQRASLGQVVIGQAGQLRASGASSRCAGARGGAPSRAAARRRRRARRSPRACGRGPRSDSRAPALSPATRCHRARRAASRTRRRWRPDPRAGAGRSP